MTQQILSASWIHIENVTKPNPIF